MAESTRTEAYIEAEEQSERTASPSELVADPPSEGAPVSSTSRALSETAWVSRAQDGDVAAFTHLVRAYEGELFRLGYRILSDRDEAQDVVQEVLVTVWRRLPSLSDPQAFRSWIYQIATRRCLAVVRRKRRQRTEVTSGRDFELETQSYARPTLPHEDPSSLAQAAAMRHGLDQGLADLPAEQRTCWVLLQLHDLTYAQIAYVVGAPVSTVRGRISRARQNLAKGMTEWQ